MSDDLQEALARLTETCDSFTLEKERREEAKVIEEAPEETPDETESETA